MASIINKGSERHNQHLACLETEKKQAAESKKAAPPQRKPAENPPKETTETETQKS